MENQTIPAPKNIPSKFDSRFVFSDTLIRVSRLIGDEKIVENMVMSTPLPYVFTEEPIPLEFDYNLAEGLIKESYSKICWSLTSKNVPSPLMISFHLTENTIEKNVFVIFEIEIVNREAIPEQYYEKINTSFPKICKEMIKNIDKELKEDNKDIYHYESKIFNYPRKKIWNLINKFHLIMSELGEIKNCNIHKSINEESTLTFNMCEDNQFCKMKINKVKCDNNSEKWNISIMPLKGPFEHYLQQFIFIRIDENKTLLLNNTKYRESISPETFKKITKEKKCAFKIIEDLLNEENDILNEKN
jgi:hypothetical protein